MVFGIKERICNLSGKKKLQILFSFQNLQKVSFIFITQSQKNICTRKNTQNIKANKMMMEHPPGLTLFPAKNPRPGPDPGGGCSSRHLPPSVVLSGGGVHNTHNNLGQVNLNDRAATTLYKPTGRIFIPSQNFVTNSFFSGFGSFSISYL